jgi:Outer membrane protein beta-barrel domain
MKSLLVTLALFFSALSASYAQGMKLGIRAGANMYKIDGKAFDDEFLYGYHAGASLEIMFSKVIGIQPEVLFNQSNTRTGYTFDTLYKSINPGTLKDVKLNYMSIPILLNIRPFPFLTLQAGPQFGVLMSKNLPLLEDGREAFKNGDLTMLAGVQLNILKFRIYGRYGIGLNNLNDIDNKDKWKSQSAQLGVGLNF